MSKKTDKEDLDALTAALRESMDAVADGASAPTYVRFFVYGFDMVIDQRVFCPAHRRSELNELATTELPVIAWTVIAHGRADNEYEIVIQSGRLRYDDDE